MMFLALQAPTTTPGFLLLKCPMFPLFFSCERCNSSPISVDVIAVPTTSYSHPCCAQTGPLLPVNSGCLVLYILCLCFFFVSLLFLCHLCVCLVHRPFSVHAQLRHAVTHHSACFLQQPFTASLFFFSAAISSCIPQTTMCSSTTFLTLHS